MAPDTIPAIDTDRIACQQILEKDHSVFSIQWIVIPPGIPHGLNSARLLQLYLDYIQRLTFGLFRSVENAAGLEFRLAGSSISLIKFLPPVTAETDNGEKTSLLISGGFLVQPQECNRGQLDFMVETVETGCRVTLKLSDYCPLLLGNSQPSLFRKWLYRLTQAYLHKIVTISFLASVYQKSAGVSLKKGVVRIAVRKGQDT